MRKLSVFNFITLNGFYKGLHEDISWHKHGDEEADFSKEGANSGSTLVFGRVTFEMMRAFWPTPEAAKTFPEVAKGMNSAKKLVFSKTLKKAGWDNTTIIKGDLISEIKKLKQEDEIGLTILGSGSLVSQLSDARLIDEYMVMIDPVAIGKGTSIFHDIKKQLDLTLISTRQFKSGCILLTYKPA